MDEIALHILDLIENSISAGAQKVEIIVEEDINNDRLEIIVKDDGKGMHKEELRKLSDPFFTTKDKKTGLGIPLLKQYAQLSDGDLEVKSQEGKGTEIRVWFRHSHIDRQPLGDVEKSLAVTISTHPEIEFLYTRIFNGRKVIYTKRKEEGVKYTKLYSLLKELQKEVTKK